MRGKVGVSKEVGRWLFGALTLDLTTWVLERRTRNVRAMLLRTGAGGVQDAVCVGSCDHQSSRDLLVFGYGSDIG